MNLIAAYGTLRKGFYNHNRFPEVEYLGTTTIKGFDLYDLGPYPCVVKSENPEQELVIDLLKVSSSTENSIDRMELGAGYNIDKINVTLDDTVYTDVTIYTYNNTNNLKNATILRSGDYRIKR